MAWKIELSAQVDGELGKLDPQQSKRILRFPYERGAPLDNLRSIGQALRGSKLGEFWNIVPVITDSFARSRTTGCSFSFYASAIAEKSTGDLAVSHSFSLCSAAFLLTPNFELSTAHPRNKKRELTLPPPFK